MPVPDQGRDDGSGMQKSLNLLDSGFRLNDDAKENTIFYGFINLKYEVNYGSGQRKI